MSAVFPVMLMGAALAAAGQPAGSAAIRVLAADEIGRVNPLVFGNNQVAYDPSVFGGEFHGLYTNYGGGVWDPVACRPVPQAVQLAKRSGMTIARFPGGCGVHHYDWKRTIGDPDTRPQWRFGVDEHMRFCAAVGCDVVITVSDFTGTAQDAADLVEYLNAPADGSNACGGVDWARRRAQNGHPAPYGVKYFEIGNESYHGNHKDIKALGPSDYAAQFVRYARAMKAVDPSIWLGVVTIKGDWQPVRTWNRIVLSQTKGFADFVVEHTYHPGYDRNDGIPPAESFYRTALSAPAQVQAYYDELNALIREVAGRPLPLTITEYNLHATQEQPVPYRLCLGTALYNAEMLRLFTQPGNNVLMANFWQFANEYWGQIKSVKGDREPVPFVRRPNFFPFQLYREHFGPRVVAVQTQCDTYDSEPLGSLAGCSGPGQEARLLGPNLLEGQHWEIQELEGVTAADTEGVLRLDFREPQDVNYFHSRIEVPAKAATWYHLSAWVRTEDLADTYGVGLAIEDDRGWTVTRSQEMTGSVAGTTEWTFVQVDYFTLPETNGLRLIARRIGGPGPISGIALIHDVALHEKQPRLFAATPVLSANAGLSDDGAKLHLMVVCKSMEESVPCTISLDGFRARPEAKAFVLTGPTIDATNEQKPTSVRVTAHAVTGSAGNFEFVFAPHSLTALEFSRQPA